MIEYSLVQTQQYNFKGMYLHFSQNLPVKPSTHWHCCQDQRSKQVPPCLQGLAVQAPSSLGHLHTQRQTQRHTQRQFDKSDAQSAAGGSAERRNSERKTGQMSLDFSPCAAKHKEPRDNLHIKRSVLASVFTSGTEKKKKKKSPEFCNWFPPSKMCIMKKNVLKTHERVWECEQMSHSESRQG